MSWAVMCVDQVGGEENGEWGVLQEGPELVHPLAEPGGVGHEQQGVRERGRERGLHGCHVADVEDLD